MLRCSFIALAVSFTGYSLLFAQDSLSRKNYQLLWEISGPDLPGPSYLFGSMHVRDAAVFEFPDSMLHYLKSADAFASEVQFDSAMYLMLRYQFQGYHDDFEIEEAVFDPLEAADSVWLSSTLTVEDDQTVSRTDRVNAFMELLSQKSKKEQSYPTMLDSYLMEFARSEDKLIFGLENLVEQMGSVYAEDSYVERDKENPSGHLRALAQLSLLQNAYLSGDLHHIWKIMQSMDSVEVWDLQRRNYHMVRSMQNLMPQYRLFTVVGAAHLPGPHGILRILERRGYTIRAVDADFNQTERFVVTSKPLEYQPYTGPQQSFVVDFPGYVVPFQTEYGARGFVHIDIGKGLYFQTSTHDFLQIDDSKIESTFFGDEEAAIATRDTIATEPWLIIDYKSDEYESDETLANYKARVYFQHGRAYLLYVAAYLHEQLEHPEADRFMNSFRPAKMESGFKLITDPTAAFQVRMPANTTHYTLLENDYDIREPAYQYRIRVYQGADVDSGARYFLRWADLSPGEGIKNTNQYLWNGLAFIERYYETSIDSTQLSKGADSLSYTGTISLNDSLALYYSLKIRTNRMILLACETEPGGAEAQAFIESYIPLPSGNQVYGEESVLQGKWSILMPQPVVHTQEDYGFVQHSPLLGEDFYYTTDSLNGMTYFATLSRYSPLYRIADEESLLQKLQDDFLDPEDTIMHQQNVQLSDGSTARELWIESVGTHLQHRVVLHSMGHYTIERYVYGTSEQLQATRLDSFLYQVNDFPDSLQQASLYRSKLDDIIQHIEKQDSQSLVAVERILDSYATSPEEGRRLQHIIRQQEQKDPMLLKLLAQRPAEELYAFYQEIYSEVAAQKKLREVILSDLSKDKKPTSLKLFLQLLLQSPAPIEEHTAVFAGWFDSTALIKHYYPELLAAFQKQIYPQYIYYLLEQGLVEGELQLSSFDITPFIDTGKKLLNSWRPDLYAAEAEHIKRLDPVYVMDFYRAAHISDTRMGDQLLAFAKKWPNESFAVKAIDVLLENQYKVPKSILRKLAKSEANYLQLMTTLSQHDQLARLPKRFYDEEKIARLMLDRDFKEYGISAFKLREDGRYLGQFQGRTVAYYRFRFNDEETKNRVAVVAAFPASESEKIEINLYLVNYSYTSTRSSSYEQTALELLQEMENW